jgi:hypothetical protein
VGESPWRFKSSHPHSLANGYGWNATPGEQYAKALTVAAAGPAFSALTTQDEPFPNE